MKYGKKYYSMMLKKIGIKNNNKSLYPIIDELLDLMKKKSLDYTNTFWELYNDSKESEFNNDLECIEWKKKWKKSINMFSNMKEMKILMRKNNPVFIPRNNLVKEAIEKAIHGNQNLFNDLLKVFSKPYQYSKKYNKFMIPPDSKFENDFKTYCGT